MNPAFTPRYNPGDPLHRFWQRSTLLIIVLIVFSIATPVDANDVNDVLVTVNGDTITAADMDRLLVATHRTMSDSAKTSFDYRKLLQKLVNDRLIIQEAKAMGMAEEDDFVERLRDEQRDKARRLFVRKTFKPDLTISEDEITRHFEDYYWKIQVRSISVSTAEEAERLRTEIKQGAPMDSIAREISLDSRKFKGGLHNLKYWKDVIIEIRNAAYKLSEGELSEVFKFHDAFMILRVEKIQDSDSGEREHWRKEITTILTNERKAATWDVFLDSLTVVYPEKVDSTILKEILADSSNVFLGDFLHGTDQIVIRIGSHETISDADLRREISHKAMNAGDKTFDEIFMTATEGAKHQARLIAAAIDNGFMEQLSILRHMDIVRDSLLMETYLSENVANRIVFNRQEFEDYYNKNIERYREPDEIQLTVLEFENEDDADLAAAALTDGADFDFVASRMKGSKKENLDDKQWFGLNTFPESIAEVFEKLQPGQNSQPIALEKGWAVFKMAGRRAGKTKSMTEVDGQIRQVMFQRKFNQLLDELLNTLKEDSKIEYDEEAITAYFGEDN